jgi:hypothetical protein
LPVTPDIVAVASNDERTMKTQNQDKTTAKNFKVTRQFIGGTLDGLTYTEITSVKFEVGFICQKPCGGSAYKITEVIAL